MPETTEASPQNSTLCRKDFPANLLVRIVKAEPVLSIDPITPEGDITFSVPLHDLGVCRSTLARTGICRTVFFVNLVGDVLVRKNLARFAAMLEQIEPQHYDRVVNSFQHRHFGMVVDPDDVIRFTLHVSLIQQILSEDLDGVFVL